MTKEEIIRNLKYTMKKHKNDRVDTFGTNISLMCKDILDYLEKEPCGKDINVPATDCISRQEAINSLGECPMNWTDSDAEITAERDWKDTVEMLTNLPSVTPQPKSEKWIPVSERLPEKENWYLVCFDDGERDLVCFDIGGFSYSRIIAWMPLPEPYKSDKGE